MAPPSVNGETRLTAVCLRLFMEYRQKICSEANLASIKAAFFTSQAACAPRKDGLDPQHEAVHKFEAASFPKL